MIAHPCPSLVHRHPMPRLSRRAAQVAAAALLALAPACGDSPTAPKPLGAGILAPGAVVDGTIQSVADTAHFVLVLPQGTDAMVYLMAKGDLLRLEVRDSTGRLVATTSDGHNTTAPERRVTAVIPGSQYRYHVDVSMVNGTSPSDYEIRVVVASRAPEHVPTAIRVGTIVSGEDIEHAYDVDSFTVSVDHDQIVDLYLRKTTRNDAIVVATVISPPPGYFLGNMSAGPADTVLGGIGSGRLTLGAGGQYFIVVYGQNADTARTPYELLLQPIDTAPEAAPAALAAGDTVHEAIDYLGDVDKFTLTGTPGTKYNLFVDAQGSAPHQVTATVAFGSWDDPTVTANAGGALGASATGVFTLPAAGTAKIRVEDGWGTEAGHVGPYRLFVYPIDTRVEGGSASLGLDETTSSRIDMFGDVDEFTLTVPHDTVVNVVVRGVSATAHPIAFTLLDARDSVIGRREPGPGSYPYIDGDSAGMGSMLLAAGTYKMRVAGIFSDASGRAYAGPYQILPRTVNTGPETRSATIAPGDTVRGESIDPAGDIDRYRMALAAGDSVYFGIEPVAATYLVNIALSTSRWDFPDRLFVAPHDGDYYITVSGSQGGINLAERVPYGLHLVHAGLAPEDRPAAFALGDTVRSKIDITGEADEFLTSAPAGATLTGAFTWAGSGPPYVWAVFIDPTTGVHLDSALAVHGNVGDVTVPASGALRVRIVGLPPCGGYVPCLDLGPTGPYSFALHVLNRGPEAGSAQYVVGDTVSETIEPADIDEYRFDGTAGDTVSVYFQIPTEVATYDGLRISLIDLTTGATLGSLTNIYGGARLEDVGIPNLVLPSTGSFQIRVQGVAEFQSRGAYRFRVARPR